LPEWHFLREQYFRIGIVFTRILWYFVVEFNAKASSIASANSKSPVWFDSRHYCRIAVKQWSHCSMRRMTNLSSCRRKSPHQNDFALLMLILIILIAFLFDDFELKAVNFTESVCLRCTTSRQSFYYRFTYQWNSVPLALSALKLFRNCNSIFSAEPLTWRSSSIFYCYLLLKEQPIL
jgi:hypothetical protein